MPVPCCLASECSNPDCIQLTERESRICEAICGSAEPIAFSSIRRTVGYHQEVVSRILRRLVNHHVIEKVRGRYRRVSQ